MHMQNFQLRCQTPGQLDDCLVKKNESRCVILIRIAALAVNSRTIKKFIASDEEKLHAAGTLTFRVLGNVSRIAHLHLDSYARVLLPKRAILSNLAIERQCHTNLMP